MKKFLSICFCLMLCLSSMLVFGACGEKPTPVAEAAAMETFETTMTNMGNEKAIKMTCNMFGEKMTMIASENKTYISVSNSMKSWAIKNGEVFDQYTIVDSSIYGEDYGYEYIKSVSPAVEISEEFSLEDFLGEFDDMFGDLEELQFAKASELDGVLTIKFEINLDEETKITYSFKIEDNALKSISVSSMGYTITMRFSYGENLLNEIPEVPTLDKNKQPIVWDEYEPKIEVEGIPAQFEVGETLDLEDIVIEFYEDVSDFVPFEEYEITIDMISGFDTTTATEPGQPRTMTITFCGFTCQVQYTVSAPAAAE